MPARRSTGGTGYRCASTAPIRQISTGTPCRHRVFCVCGVLTGRLRCARHLKRACDAITFIGKMYIYTKFLKKSLVFVYF